MISGRHCHRRRRRHHQRVARARRRHCCRVLVNLEPKACVHALEVRNYFPVVNKEFELKIFGESH